VIYGCVGLTDLRTKVYNSGKSLRGQNASMAHTLARAHSCTATVLYGGPLGLCFATCCASPAGAESDRSEGKKIEGRINFKVFFSIYIYIYIYIFNYKDILKLFSGRGTAAPLPLVGSAPYCECTFFSNLFYMPLFLIEIKE
jgi:hypothetical protein